ncbi:hypothetical protein GDO81_014367 [Engystomops pustulosus]|uniref:Uncharacterized protein n=1 Tax=Engystomops pustulosus TaxID=76066 RepID=A0AAV7B9T6_ENGPU|nr:hypothetical protein GDO81_014367 [Engystomops pustulosus]
MLTQSSQCGDLPLPFRWPEGPRLHSLCRPLQPGTSSADQRALTVLLCNGNKMCIFQKMIGLQSVHGKTSPPDTTRDTSNSCSLRASTHVTSPPRFLIKKQIMYI